MVGCQHGRTIVDRVVGNRRWGNVDICQDGKTTVDWVVYMRKLEIVYVSPKMTKPIDRVLCNRSGCKSAKFAKPHLADGLEQQYHL